VRRIASRENSLTVMMRAASLMVRATVKRSCARLAAGKYSGFSMKLTSWTVETTGARLIRGAVY